MGWRSGTRRVRQPKKDKLTKQLPMLETGVALEKNPGGGRVNSALLPVFDEDNKMDLVRPSGRGKDRGRVPVQ